MNQIPHVIWGGNLYSKLNIVIIWPNFYVTIPRCIPSVEQSINIGYMRSVAVLVAVYGKFVAPFQQIAQCRVPAAGCVNPYGIQYRSFADAVFPGQQGDAAQAGDGQLVYAPEAFYVEARQVERLGFGHWGPPKPTMGGLYHGGKWIARASNP